MKIFIKQSILLEKLNSVIKCISNKNLIPILNCIKFELIKDGLYLLSTDNEMAIKSFLPKNQIEKIETQGSFVVSGRYIYEMIRKLPNEIIEIEELDGAKIIIKTSNTEFNLNCNNVEDFPNLEMDLNEEPIVIAKEELKNVINQTLFATSVQESRPTLTGINFLIDKDKIFCTATDSYRLSKRIIKIKPTTEKLNIIIPNRTINELSKILDDEGFVEMHIFTNKVIFKFDEIQFLTRLINGTFPNTEKLIPEQFEEELEVDYKIFYEAIDRASLLSSGDEKNTLAFEINKNVGIVTSNIPEIGKVEEKIVLNNMIGNNLKISFSSKFMLEALRALNSKTVILKFNGEIKPIILLDPKNELLTEVIVPIKTY